MTSAQVVETSVNVISKSPSQDYTHPDDRTFLNDMTPGFKPFTTIGFLNSFLLFFLFFNCFSNIISAKAVSSVSIVCSCSIVISFYVGSICSGNKFVTRRLMSVHWVACGRCYSKTEGTELGGIELQRSSQIFQVGGH